MFRRMTLSARLYAGFGLLLLLLAVLAVTSGWQLRALAANTDKFANGHIPAMALEYQMNQALSAVRRWELRHGLAEQLPEMDKIEGEMAKERKNLLDALAAYRKGRTGDEQGSRMGDAAQQAVDGYLSVWEQGGQRELARRRVTDPAAVKELKALMAANLAKFQAAQKAIGGLWEASEKSAEQTRADSEAKYASVRVTMITLVLLSFAAGIGAAVLIIRSVMRELGGEPAYAKEVVGEIAQGNLAVEVALRPGDTDSLLASTHAMKTRLARIVSEVRASSDSIATGSSEIASGNVDLSQRTEEQASNLQQTAASMEQLSGTVKNSADTAAQASRLASKASGTASQGGEIVGQVIGTMGEISEASRKIADIIGVIDGIAFQTNILALNAAVEAARAGEQGRGFSVVAAEVRSLARHSSDAAKEIKALIGASVEKVEVGARQVNEAGSSMREIVEQVQRVSHMISELSSAANEQSAGIGQVNDAMTQLDQVTQQNAALVEESAAAAESLRVQADRLKQAVAIFRLDGSSATTACGLVPDLGAGGARPVAQPRATAVVGTTGRTIDRASGGNRAGAAARAAEPPSPSPGRDAQRQGAQEWATF
jgi:methyl-accepting chemotaxis protein